MSNDEQQPAEEPAKLEQWTLADVCVNGLTKSKWPLARYYYQIRIDGKKIFTSGKVVMEAGVVKWEEPKRFETKPTSTVELRLKLSASSRKSEIGKLSRLASAFLQSADDAYDIEPTAKLEPAPRITLTIRRPESELPIVVDNAKEDISAMHFVGGQSQYPHEVDSDAANETARNASSNEDTWKSFSGLLESLAKLKNLATEAYPYSDIAWKVLSSAFKLLKDQQERDQKIMDLLTKMNTVCKFALERRQLETLESHKDTLKRLSIQVIDCGYFISSYAKNPNFCARALNQAISGLGAKIDAYSETLDSLLREITNEAVVQTELMVVRIVESLEHSSTEVGLDRLSYADGAGYQPSKQCLPNTRVKLLDDIMDWISDSSDNMPCLMLLSGPAGTGKSTIAHTIAARCRTMKRLGSSFCFSTNHRERKPEHFFPTVARDLADFDQVFRAALWRGVGQQLSDRTTVDLLDQVDRFLLTPAKDLTVSGPIVFVVDALDESGNQQARRGLVDIFKTKLSQAPANFRILVTARAETDILKAFETQDNKITKRSMPTLEGNATDVRADLLTYINAQLSVAPGVLLAGFDDRCCERLREKSEGLFQWAFVACDYIRQGMVLPGKCPRERFNILITGEMGREGKTPGLYPLDDLYSTVLREILRSCDEDDLEDFRHVVGFVMTAFEPLSINALKQLEENLPRTESIPFSRFLPFMGSLLSGIGDEAVAVRPLHSSFREFAMTASRGAEFYIGAFGHHERLALCSLRILNKELHFNLCGLETSYQLNQDIENLSTRVSKCIGPHLSYACKYWAQHLHRCTSEAFLSGIVHGDVSKLLFEKLLFWLEALSLLEAINTAAPSLSIALNVIQVTSTNNQHLFHLARDALSFVQTFSSLMSESMPHIYLSALPWAPSSSCITQTFALLFPLIPRILTTSSVQHNDYHAVARTRGHSGAAVLAGCLLEGHTDDVSCLELSPDGKQFVSSLEETGSPMGAPLEGHTSRVVCLAFSPDGNRIVSGSDDKTLRIWDAETGAQVGAPLEGHTGGIVCLAFSPDGNQIISGSYDRALRIWDAETGAPVGALLEGHTGGVVCLAFSPDGNRIVSGSDSTLRIWDAETGAPVGALLEGHTGMVICLAFSPDGNRIVSGSGDKTLRIWDAETGTQVGAPLEGHTNPVNCLAFSPDGNQIVSGSADKTLRIWDAETGTQVGAPLEGHTRMVVCLAFSPDGNRIVSGSYDRTLRIWNAETGTPMGAPLEGHTDQVDCVAFSPDGNRIFSGSGDKTPRIWDAETGAQVGALSPGHTDAISCLAFSPDGNRVVSGSEDRTL